MERRINRVTAAVWHFSSGAVGSLTHSLVLHTSHYQTGQPPHTSPHASWQLNAQMSAHASWAAQCSTLCSGLLGSSMLNTLLEPLGQLNAQK